jgi:SAM-dependent methyltransferase
MTGAAEWRGDVGEVWAEEWRRTDRMLAPVNDALVAQAVALAPVRILDIGCGAGATSLALADALPAADIVGIDLSAALVGVAETRGGSRARFEVADAVTWPGDRDGFDLIVSRHGVMFFAEPVAAFAHIHGLVRCGGRLLFSCFRARDENEWVGALRPVFERFAAASLAAPDPPVGPFALADPARIESILRESGFATPRIAPLDFDFAAGAGADPVGDALAYFRRIGPFATLLRDLERDAGAAAIDLLAEILAGHCAGDRVVLRAAAWIVLSGA